MYETKTVTATADNGTQVSLVVPTSLPSNERAQFLRNLYNEHVQHPDGHWKGVAIAQVPPELADDVAEAMDFMGSIVDQRDDDDDIVTLSSRGYWAHGF